MADGWHSLGTGGPAVVAGAISGWMHAARIKSKLNVPEIPQVSFLQYLPNLRPLMSLIIH